MRNTLLALVTSAALAGATLAAGVISAEAMPADAIVATGRAPAVILVADGCGLGFHRGIYGRCRPNGGFFIRRRCFIRPTPMGPRRFCR